MKLSTKEGGQLIKKTNVDTEGSNLVWDIIVKAAWLLIIYVYVFFPQPFFCGVCEYESSWRILFKE